MEIELLLAASRGDITTVQTLLSCVVNLDASNRNSRTALMAAALNGRTNVVELLIDRGANINAQDGYGNTALSFAVWNSNNSVVKLLLENGAEAKAKDCVERALSGKAANTSRENQTSENCQTVLMTAAFRGNLDVVRMLLTKGAEVNSRTDQGKTALMFAASCKFSLKARVDTVKALLTAGARVADKDNNGKTALDYALEAEHTDIVGLLQLSK
ncbi:MAG: ankyrin repeat domain-containing protein [Acidobacteriota bacterium]